MKTILLALLLLADAGASSRGFDPRTCGLLRNVAPQGGELTSAAFSPEGRALAVGCMDGTVRLLEAGTWRELRRIKAHPNGVKAVAWGPDGRVLATGGSLAVRLWDSSTGAELRSHFPGGFDPGANLAFGLAFHPDGRTLLFSGEDGILRRWTDALDGGTVGVADPAGHYRAVAFSRDGRLAAAAAGGTVKLWKADRWEAVRTLLDERDVQSLAFSRDGRRLAAGASGAVVVWDVDRGARIQTIEGFGEEVPCAAFTADGRYVIAGGPAHAVRICEAATGKVCAAFERHAEPFLSLAIHPDGRRFVTAGSDRHLRIWGPLPSETARVRPAGFCGIKVQQNAEGMVSVIDVIAGTAAERAGLQAGDIVFKVGGVEVRNPTEAIDQISSYFEGDEVGFELIRDRVVRAARVKLGRRPQEIR
jgi:WD40 repeat protein